VTGPNSFHLQLHHVVNLANELSLQGEHTYEPAPLQITLLLFWIANNVQNIQKIVFDRPLYLGGITLVPDLKFLDITDSF
jgi:hypothetical protein